MSESENCSHDCSSCSQECSSQDLHEKLHAGSSVKKVIAVVSGKGSVGKSLVSSLLQHYKKKNGKTAILDADITGPSIPKCFGVTDRATGTDDNALLPLRTSDGIQMMSINCLLEDVSAPVVWRGPIIAGAVKQFWTDV